MEPEFPDDGSRFFTLYNMAKELCGEGILTNSRLPEPVLGRKLIIYQMRTEGFPLKTIGRYLHRTHTSVLHLQKQMQNAIDYPHIFHKEMRFWENFQKKLKENDDEKKL